MSRYRTYGPMDTPEANEGDSRFVGLDMVRDRGLLAPGILARSENKRLRNGTAATRPGTDQPEDFNPIFGNPILGSFVYTNPNGTAVMLVAVKNDDKVWVLEDGKDPFTINLDGSEDFTNTVGVEFVQSFQNVLCLRRPISSRPVLVWDGDTGNTFDPIALSTYGLKLVPATWFGQPFKDRVIYYNAYRFDVPYRDTIYVSDAGDYTSYDDVFGTFRINAGESDYITRVWPYFRSGVVIFKSQSVHLLADFTLDPKLGQQRLLSLNRGGLGNKTMVEDGGDVLFLSEPGGIYRLSEVIQDQITTEPKALSEPIQPVIDRIGWGFTALFGCAAAVDIYAFFGVCLDNSQKCNAVLVFNTQTSQWESIDTWADPNFGFHAFHITLFNRKRRLYAVDYTRARVFLMYEGDQDETATGIYPIADVIETRGYLGRNPAGFNRFQRANLALATFDPEITVTAISDGYNEEKLVTPEPITKSRLKFYPHDHADFDPATGDPVEELREDYSTGNTGDFACQDYESLSVGPVDAIPGTPIPVAGPKQQALERVSLRQNGRWCSLRIANSQGACDVLAVGIDSVPVLDTVRRVA